MGGSNWEELLCEEEKKSEISECSLPVHLSALYSDALQVLAKVRAQDLMSLLRLLLDLCHRETYHHDHRALQVDQPGGAQGEM